MIDLDVFDRAVILTGPTGSGKSSQAIHFIERHELKPGQMIEVHTRDAAADAVTVHGPHRPALTIGARAASKLLVEIAVR